MKNKVLTCLLAVLLVVLGMAGLAQADVAIDGNHFPDPAFRENVSGFDTDGDGVLSDGELKAVGEIYCSESGITDLTGIEYFTELRVLDCAYNELAAVDLSHNTKLTGVWLRNNSLTELDVSANTMLTELDVTENKMTGLDVTNNPALVTLWALTNSLKAIDVSKNTELVQLSVSDNQFTALNVDKNTKLKELYCDFNRITKLNVSKCPELVELVNNTERVYTDYGNNSGSDSWNDEANGRSMYVDPDVFVTAGSFVSGPISETSVTVDGGVYELSGSTAVLSKTESKTVKSLVIPASVKANGRTYKVTEIGASACKGLSRLTTVNIGKNVQTVGGNAFSGCKKLTAVKGGAGVVTIGEAAFSGCSVLKTFPAMNRLQTLDANAFRSCAKLTEFTLGSKVKAIGKNAFNGCKALKKVTVKTTKLTTKTVGAGAFKSIWKKAVFKCPKSRLAAYKTLFVKKGAPKTCSFK